MPRFLLTPLPYHNSNNWKRTSVFCWCRKTHRTSAHAQRTTVWDYTILLLLHGTQINGKYSWASWLPCIGPQLHLGSCELWRMLSSSGGKFFSKFRDFLFLPPDFTFLAFQMGPSTSTFLMFCLFIFCLTLKQPGGDHLRQEIFTSADFWAGVFHHAWAV